MDECKPLIIGMQRLLAQRYTTKAKRCTLKQVEPRVESAWFNCLKLNCDQLVSSFDFKFKLRRYTKVSYARESSTDGGGKKKKKKSGKKDGDDKTEESPGSDDDEEDEEEEKEEEEAGAYTRPLFGLP